VPICRSYKAAAVFLAALAFSCGGGKPAAPAEALSIVEADGPLAPGQAAGEASADSRPILVDLGTMLHTPPKNWRYGEYELFAFTHFPAIIYLFSADHAVQSLFLRRLAFFVEKRGFVGRLARDEEIENLRDWGAHDYKSADLARFFQTAADDKFPLNSHELLLKEILLANGILTQEGSAITAG
jgi:hypothetical protein